MALATGTAGAGIHVGHSRRAFTSGTNVGHPRLAPSAHVPNLFSLRTCWQRPLLSPKQISDQRPGWKLPWPVARVLFPSFADFAASMPSPVPPTGTRCRWLKAATPTAAFRAFQAKRGEQLPVDCFEPRSRSPKRWPESKRTSGFSAFGLPQRPNENTVRKFICLLANARRVFH